MYKLCKSKSEIYHICLTVALSKYLHCDVNSLLLINGHCGFIVTTTNPAVTSVTESLDDDVVMATPGASSLSHDADDNVISVRHDDVSCTAPQVDLQTEPSQHLRILGHQALIELPPKEGYVFTCVCLFLCLFD